MNTVQPIKDIEIIYDIADYLKSRNKRNYVLFMFGIYSGLRISDILKLRVRDVRNKNYIYIREKKTNKEKRFILQDDIKTIKSCKVNGILVGESFMKSENIELKAKEFKNAYERQD